jgi:RNA polymerase-binding transcription factor DksA
MNRSKLNKYEQKLVSMLARLQGDVQFLASEAKSTPTADGIEPHDFVADDLYQADQMLLSNEVNLSEEIQGALERLAGGKFGACEKCGAEIAEQRLDAIPYARRCIACASSGT